MGPVSPGPGEKCDHCGCVSVFTGKGVQTSNRIEALIAQMTIDEKVGQLGSFADMHRPFAADINPDTVALSASEVLAEIRASRVGTLFNGVGAALGREAQRIALEETRLGIPLLLAADVIHGMRTVFPIPLGEAASFEPDLAERTARVAAVEATAAGIHWTFAPAIDIARDQRWGRGAEGSGEDVLLGCVFGAARVRGFQGPDLKAEDSLLATPKHFAAYGAVSAGLEYSAVDISEQSLRDTHLPPFKACLEAGAITVMSALNDINGVPASANRWLMTDLLRGQWGFCGLVIGDYTSDMELIAHGYATDESHATDLAFTAGVDISLQSGFYRDHLPGLVERGEVSIELVDQGVRRVLWVKEQLGLFDNPYRSLDPVREADTSQRAAHEALARDAARRSMVLLRNEGAVLPLHKQGQSIALIGPMAEDRDNLEGCWTLFGDRSRYLTLAEGMRQAMAASDKDLTVLAGCGLEEPIEGGIDAAVAAAARADVVVLALGEPQGYSGEAQSRVELTLPAAQQALAEAVVAAGTPVVVLLRHGRALALQGAVRDAGAVLACWFLGSQTGPASADVLFGDYNPSARLPISFPQHSGQQPYYYSRSRSGRPELPETSEFKSRWRDYSNEALYPFGHGLSYTTFAYGAAQLSDDSLPWDGTLTATVKVTNTGKLAGEEVVQLYVHDRVASRVRPMRELKAFRKVVIAPGQSVDVSFQLERSQLAFTNHRMQHTAEPGLFDLWLTSSSIAGEAVRFRLLAEGEAAG